MRFTQNEGLPLRLSARKNYLDYMIILEPNLRFTQNEGLPLRVGRGHILGHFAANQDMSASTLAGKAITVWFKNPKNRFLL